MTEILLRNDGTFGDVDRKQRLIDVIAVPWDREAEVFWHGDIWREVFKRGAFDGIDARHPETGALIRQVRVNREHVKGATIGKIVEFDPAHTDGLFARVKIVGGPEGDHVLNLAEEDMISPSVGFRAQKPSDIQLDREKRRRTVIYAILDHLGMVEDPAYTEARVLAVRDQPGLPVADGPLPATPLLDEYVNDPLWEWARDLKSDQ